MKDIKLFTQIPNNNLVIQITTNCDILPPPKRTTYCKFMMKRIILIGSRLWGSKFCLAHEFFAADRFLKFLLFIFFYVWHTSSVYLLQKTSREKENKYLTLVQSLSWIIAARTYKFASNVKSKHIFWTSYWISFLFATYSQEDLMLVQCLHNHSASGCLEITFHHTTLMERSRVTPTLSTHSSSSVSKYRLSQTLQSARQSVKYLRSSER